MGVQQHARQTNTRPSQHHLAPPASVASVALGLAPLPHSSHTAPEPMAATRCMGACPTTGPLPCRAALLRPLPPPTTIPPHTNNATSMASSCPLAFSIQHKAAAARPLLEGAPLAARAPPAAPLDAASSRYLAKPVFNFPDDSQLQLSPTPAPASLNIDHPLPYSIPGLCPVLCPPCNTPRGSLCARHSSDVNVSTRLPGA